MFNNIGNKIKNVAKFFTIVGVVLSVIFGFVYAVVADEPVHSFLGVAFIGIGSLLSWLSSLTLYGFGQLIENTDILAKKVSDKSNVAKQTPKKPNTNEQNRSSNVVDSNEDSELNEELSKKQHQSQSDFLAEIRKTKTSDLKLILKDQRALYTDDEIRLIEKEIEERQKNKEL